MVILPSYNFLEISSPRQAWWLFGDMRKQSISVLSSSVMVSIISVTSGCKMTVRATYPEQYFQNYIVYTINAIFA